MSTPKTKSGKQLYQLLPAIYRTRDKDKGELAAYLDASGELIDLIRNILEQRIADSFPDNPPDDNAPVCQDWLLPYFAELLDVRLVSPELEGRRDEVGKAVAWRQRKGTLAAIEDIAESVGQMEVEIQEGWKRVARTARIGQPLLPARALGEGDDPDQYNPLEAARHPGLPVVTIDFRYASRAVQAAGNLVSKKSNFAGTILAWRQANRHGIPCFPGAFEDVSPRTVDFRYASRAVQAAANLASSKSNFAGATVAWQHGHYHPKCLLLFTPPPVGFFNDDIITIPWQQRHEAMFEGIIKLTLDPQIHRIRNVSGRHVLITGDVVFNENKEFRLEGLTFDNSILVKRGHVVLEKVAARRVDVQITDNGMGNPVVHARNCLFFDLLCPTGLVRLEYCTVLNHTVAERLEASDCVFMGHITRILGDTNPPRGGCIRFSRIENIKREEWGDVGLARCTRERPVFFSGAYGQAGCGVLHPATPDTIAHGAEDGGEMGVYHEWHHVIRREAMLDKLKDYLPVAIEPVLIIDPRLRCAPPQKT